MAYIKRLIAPVVVTFAGQGKPFHISSSPPHATRQHVTHSSSQLPRPPRNRRLALPAPRGKAGPGKHIRAGLGNHGAAPLHPLLGRFAVTIRLCGRPQPGPGELDSGFRLGHDARHAGQAVDFLGHGQLGRFVQHGLGISRKAGVPQRHPTTAVSDPAVDGARGGWANLVVFVFVIVFVIVFVRLHFVTLVFLLFFFFFLFFLFLLAGRGNRPSKPCISLLSALQHAPEPFPLGVRELDRISRTRCCEHISPPRPRQAKSDVPQCGKRTAQVVVELAEHGEHHRRVWTQRTHPVVVPAHVKPQRLEVGAAVGEGGDECGFELRTGGSRRGSEVAVHESGGVGGEGHGEMAEGGSVAGPDAVEEPAKEKVGLDLVGSNGGIGREDKGVSRVEHGACLGVDLTTDQEERVQPGIEVGPW
ncbi:hypothetical protein VTK26DRAFT_782 [Humicola hyalothermophila]